MKLSLVLLISAIIYLIRGLGLLFLPAELFAGFEAHTDAVGLWTAQILGAGFIAMSLIDYLSRTSGASSALLAILVGNFVAEFIGFILSAKAAATHLFSAFGWVPVGQHLVFLAAYGYYVFYRKGNP